MNKSSSLEEKKKLFLQLQKEKGLEVREKITAQERGNKIPVSFIQELFLKVIDKKYHDPDEIRLPSSDMSFTFKMKLNTNALRKSIHEIVRRHEVIRTKYKKVEGEFFQIINDVPKNVLDIVDLEKLSEGEKKDESTRLIKQRCWEKIDIFNAQLMNKFMLISRGNEYNFVVTTHHIVTDPGACEILLNEIFALYFAFSNNMPSPLPELPIQIADYSIWERKKYSNEYLNNKLKYWKKELSDRLEIKMPIDKIPSNKGTLVADLIPIEIEPELVNELKKLSIDNAVTLFTTLFAAFMSLAYCFSGYTYNEAHFNISRRDQLDIGPLIGCFSDFQYLRTDFRGDPDFKELLRRTNEALLTARDNFIPSTIYFEYNRSPAKIEFNYMPTVGTPKGNQSSIPENSKITPLILPPGPKIAIALFSIFILDIGDRIKGRISYKAEFYERKTMLEFKKNYIRLLTNIVINPNIRISEMGIPPHNSTFNTLDMISS